MPRAERRNSYPERESGSILESGIPESGIERAIGARHRPMSAPGSSTTHPDASPGWLSREIAAMAASWGSGRRITAAELIARHPDLDADAALRLIYEEVCLRREAGVEVDTTEVVG